MARGLASSDDRKSHAKQNRARHAMKGALRAIGLRDERLADLAEEAAARTGKVEVDHGETNRKTPDALPYIERGWARKRAQSAAPA